jgi:hypothetical protein
MLSARYAPAWLAVLVVLSPNPAPAQFGHHRPPPNQAPQQVNCDQLPPGVGMDKATCEQMNQMSATYNAAGSDTSPAAKPGDAQMTCDQIKAEMMQQPIQGPNQQHVAEAQSAVKSQMATTTKLQGEATAMAATESAENLAASGLAAANPLAGNAAQQALNAQQQAAHAALNAKAQAELAPEQARTMQATGAIAGDVNAQMQSNPRFARLAYLAGQKNCRG